jgi:hypothetical protein
MNAVSVALYQKSEVQVFKAVNVICMTGLEAEVN